MNVKEFLEKIASNENTCSASRIDSGVDCGECPIFAKTSDNIDLDDLCWDIQSGRVALEDLATLEKVNLRSE